MVVVIRGLDVGCASTPHHITALFRPVKGPGPEYSGSIGVGIAVEPRARACSGTGNGVLGYREPPHFSLVYSGLGSRAQEFRRVYPLPPGMGYAVSAASAVLGALASSLSNRVPIYHGLRVAHRVDAEMGTGLGDVAAIACGVGLVIRSTPGPPGESKVDCIPVEPGVKIVAGESGVMGTKELVDLYSRPYLAEEASRALHRVLKDPSLERLLEEAGGLARRLGLDERFVGVNGSLVSRIDGVLGFYVKKRMIVTVVEEDAVERVVSVLLSRGLSVRILNPSTSPPRLEYG